MIYIILWYKCIGQFWRLNPPLINYSQPIQSYADNCIIQIPFLHGMIENCTCSSIPHKKVHAWEKSCHENSMHESDVFMHWNDIVMHENGISMHYKWKENSMHEIVHCPLSHEHFWCERNIPVSLCRKIFIFKRGNIIFMHEFKMTFCNNMEANIILPSTVPIFNSCTICLGSLGMIHDRTPDCQPVSWA